MIEPVFKDAAAAIIGLPPEVRDDIGRTFVQSANPYIAELGAILVNARGYVRIGGELGVTMLASELASAVRRGFLDDAIDDARTMLPSDGELWKALLSITTTRIGQAQVDIIDAILAGGQ